MGKRHKGFTVMETMVVIAIISVLAAIGAKSYGDMVLDGNIQSTGNTLQNYTSNIEDGFFNMGYLVWASGEDAEDDVLVFLYELSDNYLNFSLDYDTLELFEESDCWGFTIETSPDGDSWGGAYQMTYKLSELMGLEIMIASPGPDSVWSERATSYYQTGDYDDDIVMVMSLR